MCVCVCVCIFYLFALSVLLQSYFQTACAVEWIITVYFLYSCNAIWYFDYTPCIVSFSSLFISHVNTYFANNSAEGSGGEGRHCKYLPELDVKQRAVFDVDRRPNVCVAGEMAFETLMTCTRRSNRLLQQGLMGKKRHILFIFLIKRQYESSEWQFVLFAKVVYKLALVTMTSSQVCFNMRPLCFDMHHMCDGLF